MTYILKRLEQRGLIKRIQDTQDRRRVLVEPTAAGLTVLLKSPPLLQEGEQTQLLASLQRIASMMDAEDIDAAPVLSSGSVRATAEAVGEVLEPATATRMESASEDSVTSISSA